MEEFWTNTKEYNELIDAIGNNWISKPDVRWVTGELHCMEDDGDHIITTILWTNPSLKTLNRHDIVDEVNSSRNGMEWDYEDDLKPKWQPIYTNVAQQYRCTECGHVLDLPGDPMAMSMYYCPYCGERLVSEEQVAEYERTHAQSESTAPTDYAIPMELLEDGENVNEQED